MTQNAEVLQTILDYGSITTYEAFVDLGIARLGSRIHDLRRKYDVEIDSQTIRRKNRYGRSVHYSKYTIPAENRESARFVLCELKERKRRKND